MIRAATILGALLLLAASAAPAARAQTCVGDCNHDNMVLVNELIIGVNIALDQASIDACPEFDLNGDGKVTINELITAVGNALNGCMPTPGIDRTFAVAEPGVANAPPDATRSGVFTSALFNGNAATMISSGPFTIVMGEKDANGIAPLSLKEDVTLEVAVINGQCLCMKFMSTGTTGSIDCGQGNTPYDTKAERPANAPDLQWTATAGLGAPPNSPGHANLLVPTLFQLQPVTPGVCDDVDCTQATYTDPPNLFAFTTTKALAIQGGSPPKMLEVPGEAFDCDHFDQPGQGMLAAPAPTTQIGIDVANVFRFADRP